MEQKLNQDIINKLKSGNTQQIGESLDWLRKEGEAVYLPMLIDSFAKTKNNDVRALFANFLNDIKNEKAVPVFVEAIQQERNQSILQELVSACWQCGLDFSEYHQEFAQLFLTAEFEVGIEVYSVFMNMEDSLRPEQKKAVSKEIKLGIKEMEEVKQKLAFQITDLMEL